MTTDDTEIVSALQLALADKVGQERFELWFGAATRLDLTDDALTVRVPSAFFQDWMRANFRRQIEDSCCEALGRSLPVRFHVDTSLAGPHAATPAADASPGPVPAQAAPPARSARHAAPADENNHAPRRRFADLASFVVGPTNRLAHVAAQSVASRLGTTSPLVIHGPTSVGKTHLLEGIWTAAKRAHPGIQAVYLSAEQFTSFFLEALQGSGLPSFRRKYRGLDLLIVDDVQFFAGKRATLVELLHTVNTLLREGRQLVLAADRPPAELAQFGPELTTRLVGGLVCRIDPPEYETRLGIAHHMAVRLGLALAPEVERFIAASVHSHARELAGALKRLHAASEALGRPISLALAQEALADLVRHSSRSVRLADIEKAVCNVFGLEPDSLQSKRTGKSVSQPRMLAMWLARKYTRAALSEIGHYFGHRSHSTVISAQKKVNAWMAGGAPLVWADRTYPIEEAIRRVEECLRAG